MKRSCEKISEMLVDYADGRLSASESSEVDEHLAKCDDCRKTLRALQRSLELASAIWEDGLAETEAIHIPVAHKIKKAHQYKYAAIAASILLIFTGSIALHVLVGPAKSEPTLAEIERRITDSASASRLLTAADLLAKYPDTKEIAKRQYHYVVKKYPQTSAAAQAKLRIQ
jgi:predicted anti-sigma-YlaC factor YlaD